MNTRLFKLSLVLSSAALVAACGGGGGDNCGGSTIALSVSYPTTQLKKDVATTVTPNFSPESCRSSATFTKVGSVPTGMVFNSSGTVSGTPTATGTFAFSYSVNVSGYTSSGRTANASLTVVP